MAIYHLHTKIISRSKGKSSVGASAYRSGEKLYNKRDGLEHDYTRKKGVVYKEIFVDNGMVADFVIHDKKDGNSHAHIMLTMRPFKRIRY